MRKIPFRIFHIPVLLLVPFGLCACADFYNPSIGDPSPDTHENSTSSGSTEPPGTSHEGGSSFTIGTVNSLETASTALISISLPISGAEALAGTACSTYAVLAVPSNPTLFDAGSFTLTGIFPNCSLQIQPAAAQCGTSTVNLAMTIPGYPSQNITFDYTANGMPHVLSIENAPDGIGVSLDTTSVNEATAGATLTAYAVVRNQCGDFVKNQSVIWALSPTVGTNATLGSAIGSSTTLTVVTAFTGPRATLDLPLTASHADYTAAAATIAYHFTNANLQLWLDAQASESLFQDTSETTPAVANGDFVRLWKDQSGKGRNATLWSDTRKPALDTSGAQPTVRFTKDCLQLGTNGEDFDILDSDAFTLAFVVSRRTNANSPSMADTVTYPDGRYMPLFSMQDFTLSPAEGLLRIVANNAYAAVTQYRTNRETSGNYWFSSNSISNNGGQCFGNSSTSGTCPAGSASEATQVFVTRGDITLIQQQIHRTGTLTTGGLGATVTAADITAMRNSASSSFPTFLGCDYDQSAGSEFDGIFVSSGTTGHFPFTGTFSEVIIYNEYLSDTNTVALINALASKWGL